MAIIYATLAKEVDGVVEYIYPKTTADVVEYDKSDSVKSKIEKIDINITEVNDRITNVVKGIQYGTLTNVNDAELFDIRVPNHNLITDVDNYDTAGNAVRAQFEAILSMINSIKESVEEIKNSHVSDIETVSETVYTNQNNIEVISTQLETASETINSNQSNITELKESVPCLEMDLSNMYF